MSEIHKITNFSNSHMLEYIIKRLLLQLEDCAYLAV